MFIFGIFSRGFINQTKHCFYYIIYISKVSEHISIIKMFHRLLSKIALKIIGAISGLPQGPYTGKNLRPMQGVRIYDCMNAQLIHLLFWLRHINLQDEQHHLSLRKVFFYFLHKQNYCLHI